jgi:hypothetical protein
VAGTLSKDQGSFYNASLHRKFCHAERERPCHWRGNRTLTSLGYMS